MEELKTLKIHPLKALTATFAAIIMAAGCVRELEAEGTANDEQINLLIEENGSVTKAADYSENEFQIDLPGNVSIPVSITRELATKTAPMNKTDNTLSSICLWADMVETGQKYISGQLINKDAKGNWKTNRFWPRDKALSFLACASSAAELGFTPSYTTSNTGEISCSFSYEVSKGSGAMAGKDAEVQEDVLIGISTNKTYSTGTVPLNMNHALAAIRFKVGSVPNGITLKSIGFANVYGKGNCTVTGEGSALNIVWSSHSETRSYSQSYDQPMTTGDAIGSNAQTFLLIPQAFATEDAQLQVEVLINGRTYVLKKALKDIVTSFDAENLYTFTIGTAEEVDVEITDHVDGAVKSGVEISNAGFSPVYVRMAMIGYWVDASGTVVSPWTEGEGEFEGWSSKWVEKPDGFYYYTEELPGHTVAEPPFQKYTLKIMKQEGLKLNLNICVQIIHPIQIDKWPYHPANSK